MLRTLSRRTIFISVLVCTVLGAANAKAYASDALERHGEILKAIRNVHEKQKNVGLSAAIWLDGKLAFSERFGLSDLERKLSVREDTQFLVASVTKAFTGAVLIKLNEQGQIDLDAPIQKYVPAFPATMDPPVTTRLLAAHLAGIRHYRSGEKSHEFFSKHYEDVRDALELFKNDSLLSEPGSAYRYSSYGYNLLAAAIQNAAGTPFQRVVEELVLEPLQLTNTAFDDVHNPAPNLSKHYTYYVPFDYREVQKPQPVPHFDYSYNMGGGNMITTAEDLIRFGSAFLQPGFFTKESWEMFFSSLSTEQAESPWSYGWFVSRPEAKRRDIHITGAFAGTQAGLWVFPDDQLVITVLSNSWGVGSKSGEMVIDLPKRMADIVLGE